MANKDTCLKRVFIASVYGADSAKKVKAALPNVDVINLQYDPSVGITEEAIDHVNNAEILLCDPVFLVECLRLRVPHTFKWVQLTWAGIDDVLKAVSNIKSELDFRLTRTGEGYGQLMGEYVLGHIISREHHFQALFLKQKEKEWSSPFVKSRIGMLRLWAANGLCCTRQQHAVIRPLTSLTIGFLGFGSIASEVARMCKEMGMTVWALSRTEKTPRPSVDHLRTSKDLRELLRNCDYICSILPDTPDTHDLLSGDILKECQTKKSVLINIGRGNVISEESLVRAIRESWLGGAVLDVFREEPLPSKSILWTLDRVLITPHVSGPFSVKVADAFVNNFHLYEANQPLNYVVDWKKGY